MRIEYEEIGGDSELLYAESLKYLSKATMTEDASKEFPNFYPTKKIIIIFSAGRELSLILEKLEDLFIAESAQWNKVYTGNNQKPSINILKKIHDDFLEIKQRRKENDEIIKYTDEKEKPIHSCGDCKVYVEAWGYKSIKDPHIKIYFFKCQSCGKCWNHELEYTGCSVYFHTKKEVKQH